MTMHALAGLPVEYPSGVRLSIGNAASTSQGTANILLDAADEAVAMTCVAPKAGNIDRIKFRTNTVTTGADLNVALEAVGSNGMPAFTKALFDTNTEATCTVANGDDNVWKEVTLTAAGAVTRDLPFCIVIRNPSSSAGTLNIASRATSNPMKSSTGARVRASQALGSPPTVFADLNLQHPMVAFRYDDGTWHTPIGTAIYGTGGATNFNSSSATNRRGNRFKLPVKTVLTGAWHLVVNPFAGSEWYIKLYDDSGTELASSELIDGDYASGSTNDNWWPCYFTSEYTLAADTWYRIAMVPNNTTGVSLGYVDLENADIMSAVLGGANMHRTLYTSSAWVDTGTTSFEEIILMLSTFSDDAGSGGGSGGGPLMRPRLAA